MAVVKLQQNDELPLLEDGLGLTDRDERWALMNAVLGAGDDAEGIPDPVVGLKSFSSVMVGLRRSDGRMLVVATKKNPGRFQPVGGQVEEGESMIEAACREIREETGLEIEKEKLTFAFRSAMDRRPGNIDMFVLDVDDSFEPVLQDEEIHEARWIQPSEAEELSMFQTSKRFFSRFS